MKSRALQMLPALAAGAFIVAATTANAQAPFSGIPASSDILIRIDMEALLGTPALAPVVSELRAKDPNFQNFVFNMAAEEKPELAGVLGNFPGHVKVYEMGLTAESLQGGSPQAFMVARGDFDAQAIHERLTTTTGWTEATTMAGTKIFKGPEGSETVLTMPRQDTILMAPSEASMGDLLSSYAAATTSARDGAMSSLVSQYAGAPVFIALQLPADAKEMLSQMAQNPPAEAAFIPGAPNLIREVGSLDGGVLTLGGQGNNAILGVVMNFANGESAGRATSALNNMLPALAMMGEMQAQGDPQMLAQIDQLKALRFSQSGTGVGVNIPVPPDQLQMAIAGIEEATGMGMMGGGGAGDSGSGQINFR